MQPVTLSDSMQPPLADEVAFTLSTEGGTIDF